MPTRLRKIRKFRGSRSYGWGQVGQHRGAGRRGGRGEAGGHKHGWSRTIVYEPDHFGKHGFKRSWVSESETINVGELDDIVDRLVTQNLAKKNEDGIHVDLRALGIGKLLGAGKVERPMILKVAACSETAGRKIEDAKGKIVLDKD